MLNLKKIKTIINEYGIDWVKNRTLYSIKLKSMVFFSLTEKCYEKKTPYTKRLNIFRIDVGELKKFIQKLGQEEKKSLTETADKAIAGIIHGFSSVELNYGNPIDWQLNPLTGKRCNENKKWYMIPDFDKERGDIKVIWEISRFSHFITLARAYLLTGDAKYYQAFSSQLKSWLTDNKYSYGANYKCGQECSLRMINALLAYSVFRECECTTDADASNMKDLIDRCYRKIISNFFYAYKCIKNNHTISEIMGMIAGAWCCEDQEQLKKAYGYLDEVIDEQFTSDGGYRQLSFNYQRLALQDIECIMSMNDMTGFDISVESKGKVMNAALLLYQCQDISGDVPNYGSNDGALVFPVTSCSYRDFSPVINTSYALITGKQLFRKGYHQEELLWFSAGKKLTEYDICEVKRESSQFAEAGLFTLRNKDSWTMIVSNDYKSRPGHMDQLHFDLWSCGVNIFCDLGTYSYASDEGKKFVSNESHNTVIVENLSQMNSNGPFMIYGWTKRKLGKCSEKRFSSKIVSLNGYIHKRSVNTDGTSYQIIDKVNKEYQIRFHTPCDVKIIGKKAVLFYEGKVLCVLTSTGKLEVTEGQRSLYYLQKETIHVLSIIGQAGTEIKTKIQLRKGDNKNG